MTLEEFEKKQKEIEEKNKVVVEPKIKVKITKGSVNGCKKGSVIEIEKSLIESLALNNSALSFKIED